MVHSAGPSCGFGALAALAPLAVLLGCASPGRGDPDAGGGVAVGSSGTGGLDLGDGPLAITSIPTIVRDFRFFDLFDLSTDPDFEDPPFGIGQNGQPSSGYLGPWDDPDIVADALGADGTPTYENPGGRTLTTHGAAAFAAWYHDTPRTNVRVVYPLPLARQADGVTLQYDSDVQGVPYGPTVPDQGSGFFPIDDGSAYATTFGDQGKAHNYSFTVEIHTVFTYKGGEHFTFRGDDDVFVFIDGQLVINLGGIHGPESRDVRVDSLNLTKGQTYPLDFFSAERHVTGSNIQFQTTLDLKPAPSGH